MSIYMSRLLQRSNSSFSLCRGNALITEVSRLRGDICLADAGIGTPVICKQDELTGVPNSKVTRFKNKVGFLEPVARESPIQGRQLERIFVDLVAGDSLAQVRATARFNEFVGSNDGVPGEPHLLLPRRFRQYQAWRELNRAKQTNRKVRGFFIQRVRGGYAVAIAGYIAFLPFRAFNNQRPWSDRFTIGKIEPNKEFVVY